MQYTIPTFCNYPIYSNVKYVCVELQVAKLQISVKPINVYLLLNLWNNAWMYCLLKYLNKNKNFNVNCGSCKDRLNVLLEDDT